MSARFADANRAGKRYRSEVQDSYGSLLIAGNAFALHPDSTGGSERHVDGGLISRRCDLAGNVLALFDPYE